MCCSVIEIAREQCCHRDCLEAVLYCCVLRRAQWCHSYTKVQNDVLGFTLTSKNNSKYNKKDHLKRHGQLS